MLRLAFDFIITWRETRTRPNAYKNLYSSFRMLLSFCSYDKNRKSLSVKQLFLIKILELCTKMA